VASINPESSTGSQKALDPPGPVGLPYYGCLNGLLRNPMKFWSGIAQKYGGIARVPLKKRSVYLISDPDLLYELLVTKRNKYRKNIRYKAAVDTFGRGLLLNEGEAWRHQRRITQPTFKADYIESQAASMVELTGRLVTQWKPLADQGAIRDVHEDFMRLAQLISGHYLMGSDFDSIEENFYTAAIGVKDNWPLPPRSILATFFVKHKEREARLDAAIHAIEQLVYGYIARHRKTDFQGCGVLEVLAKESRAHGDEFDDQSLRDQLLTLFFAGHETSAASLSWIHYLLSENPDCRNRLLMEVHDVVGHDRPPSADDLSKLVYTEQVVNESLRLHSPIHSVSRVALEDDTIGGFRIPADAMIYISLYATNRLESLWPDPERFDPDRFTLEQIAERPRFAFIPFAAGHRNCIGAAMATAELKLSIAQLAQHYVLEVAPGHRVVEEAGTTMYPKYGMKMTIRHAHAAGTAPASLLAQAS
jgi:cytochrome P450